MTTFSFDINKMIKWLMPSFLYQPIHYAWLQVLLAPMVNQYTAFLAYMQLQLKNATIDSSVNRLTQALWDNFDSTDSIYITQNDAYDDEDFIYLTSDGATPAYDYLISDEVEPYDYDFLADELNSTYNFTVWIPIALVGDTTLINAFVSKYVFSGITFQILTF